MNEPLRTDERPLDLDRLQKMVGSVSDVAFPIDAARPFAVVLPIFLTLVLIGLAGRSSVQERNSFSAIPSKPGGGKPDWFAAPNE